MVKNSQKYSKITKNSLKCEPQIDSVRRTWVLDWLRTDKAEKPKKSRFRLTTFDNQNPSKHCPKINKSWSKMVSWISSIFWCDLAPKRHPKNHPKSIPKTIKKSMFFFIEFWSQKYYQNHLKIHPKIIDFLNVFLIGF